jgi:hypothetical protein
MHYTRHVTSERRSAEDGTLHHQYRVTVVARVDLQPIFTTTTLHNVPTNSCEHGHHSAAVTASAERSNTSPARLLTYTKIRTSLLTYGVKKQIQGHTELNVTLGNDPEALIFRGD